MGCFICFKPARGFGWHEPGHRRVEGKQQQATGKRYFCSRTCQQIHYQHLRKDPAMMDRLSMEQKALELTLQPLADYVVKIGMDKGLGQYSKAEILGLVETVIDNYRRELNTLLSDEVPF